MLPGAETRWGQFAQNRAPAFAAETMLFLVKTPGGANRLGVVGYERLRGSLRRLQRQDVSS